MTSNNNHFSQKIIVFHERNAPEEGSIVGYAALIGFFKLEVPLPDRLVLISQKHKQYETQEWIVFTPRHQPEKSLMGHLTFAYVTTPMVITLS